MKLTKALHIVLDLAAENALDADDYRGDTYDDECLLKEANKHQRALEIVTKHIKDLRDKEVKNQREPNRISWALD